MSPTQRSLKELRKHGWLAEITEHWNAHIRRRQDLAGFVDIVAVKGDMLMWVQTTSGSNVSARVAKILANEKAPRLLAPSRRIIVHGWRKVGPRGKRKVWECREVEITPEQFQAGKE